MKITTTILILFVCFGCSEKKPVEVGFTLDDIMTIYQNGYLTGQLQSNGNKLNNWKQDSLQMANRFKPLFK